MKKLINAFELEASKDGVDSWNYNKDVNISNIKVTCSFSLDIILMCIVG